MKPLERKALEGRVNPKGIPCLYLADDLETAIAETRSLVGDLISIGYFNTTRDLSLIDFTEESESRRVYFRDPPDEKIDAIVWRDINDAFSTPVTRNEDIAEYAPTQISAEHIKSSHSDGILYRSRLGSGRNIALFNLGSAEMHLGELYRVDSVAYRFSSVDGPFGVCAHSSRSEDEY